MIRFNTFSSIPPFGLSNAGFTCYYNALLQSLLSCPSFNLLLLRYTGDNPFLSILKQAISIAKQEPNFPDLKSTGITSWAKWVERLPRPFSNGQQCVAEGYTLFLDSIDPELRNRFHMKRRNDIVCTTCNYVSSTHDTCNFFDGDDINKLFQYEIQVEWVCEKCGDISPKSKTSTLVEIAEVITVLFKNYTIHNNTIVKTPNTSSIPLRLQFNLPTETFVYEAVATIDHYGTMSGGHYVAFCRRFDEWYQLNDTTVAKIDQFQPTSNTYMIMYHLI